MKEYEKYVKRFEREGRYLNLYVKIPFWKNPNSVYLYFKNKYFDKNNGFSGCMWTINQNELKIMFILRDYEIDVKPYLSTYPKYIIPRVKVRELIDKRQDELHERNEDWSKDIRLKTLQEIYYMGEKD